MASQPNITLPDSVLAAVREEAERQQKTPDEIAGELILRGLARSEERKSALLNVMERISQQQKERGGPPDEAQIVAAVHAHRLKRRGR